MHASDQCLLLCGVIRGAARIQLSLQSQQPPDVFDKLAHRCNNCSENHERLEDVTKLSEECA